MAARSAQDLIGFIQPNQLLWKLSDSARQFRQRRSLTPEAALGRKGEDLAHRYLRRAGFVVLARNYRPGGGEAEVDIIARHGDTFVFIEVKTRSSAEFGSPERQIDREKQSHITRAARSYAQKAGIEWSQVRFDTISVVFSKTPSVLHQQDAFFEGRAV